METGIMADSQQTEANTAAPKAAQKDMVYAFALEALNLTEGANRPLGSPALRSLVTKEVRKAVRLRLFAGMKDGTIKLARPMDDSKLKKYCSSLVNNWMKKDPRFN